MSDIDATIQDLKKVSPSFCLAKWLQVTLHLHTGETHSCHHPQRHKIDAQALDAMPSALHNTQQKMAARKQMLEGDRPGECDYCWSIEDAAPENLSDRHFKSNDDWARPHFDRVKKAPWDQPINPTYVEVNFSNTCNFKCGYCEPSISSSWMQESRKHGPYQLGNFPYNPTPESRNVTVTDEAESPYVKAFWKWWPDLSQDLRVFRVTGGEPLLSPNTFKIIDFLGEKPAPQLDFVINSNLGVASSIVDKMTTSVHGLLKEKKIQSFQIYTSLDTFGADAEYIRYGLDLELFKRNVDHVLKNISGFKLVFMVTFNALSFPRFKEFLSYVMELRRKVQEDFKNGNEVLVDISYLRHPQFFAANHLTPDFFEDGEDILRFMLQHRADQHPQGFYDSEIEKMRRLLSWMHVPISDEVRNYSGYHFREFVKEHDRRRGTDFLKTFPRYREFFEHCGRLAEKMGCSK